MNENVAQIEGVEKIEITENDVQNIMNRYLYTEENREIITKENLLPTGVLTRLHSSYPNHSGLMETRKFLFTNKEKYSGLKGFREVVEILSSNGIDIGYIEERELFIKIYRFMATRHSLNSINWDAFAKDSVFQLVMPQPGMVNPDTTKAYLEASSEEEKEKIINDYIEKNTNPHDGKQKLNKPWFENEMGDVEFVEGSQHKYPQCKLVFDKSSQSCFAFCTYCFRHAQVRGDEDMFLQDEISQVHEYMKQHKEITDFLITGGDAGYMPPERFEAYITPIIEDPELMHIKTIRLGTRVLTYQPEMVLSHKYDRMLELFDKLYDNGIQVAVMNHFSTPREVLNPSTLAAIRRLKNHNVTLKSQSPIMNHISLFRKEDGAVDVDRSAQNWIDLANVIAVLGIGFHSMYCARPTGEHHYFTTPLADIDKVFSKIYRELPSINRPSRYISMTSSAGKISVIGTAEVNGETVFALKFTEARNMEWMDKVFLAKYDELENTIANLTPYDTDKFFFEDELAEIENKLETKLADRLKK